MHLFVSLVILNLLSNQLALWFGKASYHDFWNLRLFPKLASAVFFTNKLLLLKISVSLYQIYWISFYRSFSNNKLDCGYWFKIPNCKLCFLFHWQSIWTEKPWKILWFHCKLISLHLKVKPSNFLIKYDAGSCLRYIQIGESPIDPGVYLRKLLRAKSATSFIQFQF